MGMFKTPSIQAPPPPPPAPAPPPPLLTPQGDAAGADAQRRAVRGFGQSQMNPTGPAGLVTPATTTNKPLLGG